MDIDFTDAGKGHPGMFSAYKNELSIFPADMKLPYPMLICPMVNSAQAEIICDYLQQMLTNNSEEAMLLRNEISFDNVLRFLRHYIPEMFPYLEFETQ